MCSNSVSWLFWTSTFCPWKCGLIQDFYIVLYRNPFQICNPYGNFPCRCPVLPGACGIFFVTILTFQRSPSRLHSMHIFGKTTCVAQTAEKQQLCQRLGKKSHIHQGASRPELVSTGGSTAVFNDETLWDHRGARTTGIDSQSESLRSQGLADASSSYSATSTWSPRLICFKQVLH